MTPVKPIVRMRQCAGCPEMFATPHGGAWGQSYHSAACARASARERAPKPAPRAQLVTRAPSKRSRTISPASPEQRAAIRERACIVDAGHPGPCHPAHLIARSELGDGQDEPRAVVPLCPACHGAYDAGMLDLLPHLEPREREALAYAVQRFGLIRTLERVTNERWCPVGAEAA